MRAIKNEILLYLKEIWRLPVRQGSLPTERS